MPDERPDYRALTNAQLLERITHLQVCFTERPPQEKSWHSDEEIDQILRGCGETLAALLDRFPDEMGRILRRLHYMVDCERKRKQQVNHAA